MFDESRPRHEPFVTLRAAEVSNAEVTVLMVPHATAAVCGIVTHRAVEDARPTHRHLVDGKHMTVIVSLDMSRIVTLVTLVFLLMLVSSHVNIQLTGLSIGLTALVTDERSDPQMDLVYVFLQIFLCLQSLATSAAHKRLVFVVFPLVSFQVALLTRAVLTPRHLTVIHLHCRVIDIVLQVLVDLATGRLREVLATNVTRLLSAVAVLQPHVSCNHAIDLCVIVTLGALIHHQRVLLLHVLAKGHMGRQH